MESTFVTRKELIMYFFSASVIAIAFGAVAGMATFNLMNVKLLAKVETLEKTCRNFSM